MRWLFCFLAVCGCADEITSPERPVVARDADPVSAPPIWVATCTEPPAAASEESDDDATEWFVGDYCLTKYFRSKPFCEPCDRWARLQEHLVECKLKSWDTSLRPLEWVSSVPVFRLSWCSTATKEWEDLAKWQGYTTAEVINAAISEHRAEQEKAKPAQSVVCGKQLTVSQSELRAWLSEHYPPGTPLERASVSPPSMVWSHLRGAKHQFTQAQVNGLSQREALALHDAAHPKKRDGMIVAPPLYSPWGERFPDSYGRDE